MSKVFKYSLILFSVFCLTLTSLPPVAHAQYKGSYSNKKKKYIDAAARPVPKIFSSQVTSTKEAAKLDELYNELYVSLWNYAITDFGYQKKLYALVEPKRFNITRYAKEFSTVDDAIDNLNRNYKNVLSDIETANKQYEEIKEGIREEDYAALDQLWPEKIKEYRAHAKRFYDKQYQFLKTYRSLVAFILKQGGSYYYNANEQRVKFYKFGGYQFFGQSIDKLNMISFEQKKILKAKAPANVDIASIK